MEFWSCVPWQNWRHYDSNNLAHMVGRHVQICRRKLVRIMKLTGWFEPKWLRVTEFTYRSTLPLQNISRPAFVETTQTRWVSQHVFTETCGPHHQKNGCARTLLIHRPGARMTMSIWKRSKCLTPLQQTNAAMPGRRDSVGVHGQACAHSSAVLCERLTTPTVWFWGGSCRKRVLETPVKHEGRRVE